MWLRTFSEKRLTQVVAVTTLTMLCHVPQQALSQPAKPTPSYSHKPKPPATKPPEIPSSKARKSTTSEGTSSKESENQHDPLDPASILSKKAIAGRINTGSAENGNDLFRIQSAGWQIFRSQFLEWNNKKKHEKQFDHFVQLISPSDYKTSLAKHFEETTPGLEAIIQKSAGTRGFVIFSGGWNKGGSIVSLSRPPWGKEYSLISAQQVAQAVLYLPYITETNISDKGKSWTKATAPLVAIDEKLFYHEENEVVYHREVMLDPRVQAHSYKATDTGLIELRQLESRQLEFKPGEAEPATVAKLLGCCVYIRPPAYKGQLVKFFKELKFSTKHLRIALMVHDSATRSFLERDAFLSVEGRSESINRATKDIEKWVVTQLKKASGGTLLLLSHVEGKDYVVRNSNGTEVGRIPIQRVNDLALRHEVTLLNLGCRTADVLHQYDGIGVYDAFNSLHMLKAISTTLKSGPKTVASFLEKLGTPEARIVIPASIMANKASVAALRTLHDQAGRDLVEGNLLRIPAIEPIVSPNGMIKGYPTSTSVFLTSSRQSVSGFFPVVAELQIVMPACKVLAAAKRLKWEGSDLLNCEQYRNERYVPVQTHLYGDPDRKFR